MTSALLKDRAQNAFQEQWPSMEPVIQRLLQQDPVTKADWQNLFWSTHTVCLWDEKGAPKVYRYLQEAVQSFVKLAYDRIGQHEGEYETLKAYIGEWDRFFTQCSYLPLPFGQLEQALSGKNTNSNKPKQPHESIVRKLMLDTWQDVIFSQLRDRLLRAAMHLLDTERRGTSIEGAHLVVGVRDSFVHLCTSTEDRLESYRQHFETVYVECLTRYYQSHAAEFLADNGVHDFMRYADSKLKEEEERGLKYLETSGDSLKKIRDQCVQLLVTRYRDSILAECPTMVRHHDTDKLSLMFGLLDRGTEAGGGAGGVEPMLRVVEDHIKSAGLDAMMANADTITQDCERYVEQLLELFQKFSALVRDAFHSDPRFLTSRDKAFKDLVNDTSVFKLELPARGRAGGPLKSTPESRCPELLANYCDMLLRKTTFSKRLTADEVDEKLRSVLCLLKYVQNKDVFMRYHKGHLSRRLILDTSADSEKEENMVDWLRGIGMPADYVNKLSRMFQDVKVSQDLNAEFHDSRPNVADNVNIKILNAGAWARGSERVSVTLPTELEDYIPELEEFYRAKHSGRKLQWHHHMSNGTITFTSKLGRYDVDITTFQMAVLFAWNQRPAEKISLENLRLATELPDAELRRTLWTLVACSKLKRQLLLYAPEVHSAKEFVEDTQFWVNQQFAVVKNGKPMPRGKVNVIGRLQLSTEKSREEENEGIIQLRILRTQEAIVKIMKMRKVTTNAQLQTELIEILKNMFLPSKKMIKEQIEWLIENKYMKRDPDDINKFKYMA
ncbi:cullin-5-like [Amphibalanus amphitrite]|uniref:cullin-5-like n=1 Tax=Amphibalanus amphitrite TaxID=1232801 RepID=UPI001C90E057|nr:cullin-5-like [Amphibalanus amphitrite]XP_043240837.1 cullin-5-like [Amphibalanus amphitrite]XP_043240838.1 cullin-5-like [Amphibalanus amphitrite]XP_043240839.1 cullin-5-like [Amphibalanus amphitrite]